jgi:hypothetical protein
MQVSGQLHVQAALLPRKEPLLSAVYEGGFALQPVWTLWRGEKPLAPASNQTPDFQPVALLIELPRLPNITKQLKPEINYSSSWPTVWYFSIWTASLESLRFSQRWL